MRRVLVTVGIVAVLAAVTAGVVLPTAQAQHALTPGAVIALHGTPHLWIADDQGVVHWGGDTRGLAGRYVNWGARITVGVEGLRALRIGDPWLSAGLLKDGDPIYLVKWESDWPQPQFLHIQSIADVELFGINGSNYGRFVLDRPTWEARYGVSAASLIRGVLPPAVAVADPPPTPPPTASTPSGPTLPNHPQAALVRDTAIARGASADLAVRIATNVIGRGTPPHTHPPHPPHAHPHLDSVDAFLRGTDTDVSYGTYPCQPHGGTWRSPQCPLAPERLPPPAPPPAPSAPAPQPAASLDHLVDPGLRPALDLVAAAYISLGIDGILITHDLIVRLNMPVVFGPSRGHATFWFSHSRTAPPSIVINERHRHEAPRAIAPTLAHELMHAAHYYVGRTRRGVEACVEEEILAETAAASVWSVLRPGGTVPLTDLEWSAELSYYDWIDGTLSAVVGDRYRYGSCAAA